LGSSPASLIYAKNSKLLKLGRSLVDDIISE
jgi:hypothetical protein